MTARLNICAFEESTQAESTPVRFRISSEEGIRTPQYFGMGLALPRTLNAHLCANIYFIRCLRIQWLVCDTQISVRVKHWSSKLI